MFDNNDKLIEESAFWTPEQRFKHDFPLYHVFTYKLPVKRDALGNIDYHALYASAEEYLYKGMSESSVKVFKIVRRGKFDQKTLQENGFADLKSFAKNVNEHYWDIDKSNVNLVTLLAYRHEQGIFDVIYQQRLLNFGDKNVDNGGGNSKLHWACCCNQSENVLNDLIVQGDKVNQPNKAGWTPFHYAAYNGHLNAAQFLINNGAEVNRVIEKDSTILHVAAQNGYLEVVRLLVDNGANVNQINKFGVTPLHWAAMTGYLEIAKYLLEKGADVNQAANSKRLPLHFALKEQQDAVALLLIGNMLAKSEFKARNNGKADKLSLLLEQRALCNRFSANDIVKLFKRHVPDYLDLITLFLRLRQDKALGFMLQNDFNFPENFDIDAKLIGEDSLIDILQQEYPQYQNWLNQQQLRVMNNGKFVLPDENHVQLVEDDLGNNSEPSSNPLTQDRFGLNRFDQILLFDKQSPETIGKEFSVLSMVVIKQIVENRQFPCLPIGFYRADEKLNPIEKKYGGKLRSRRVSGVNEWYDLAHFNASLNDNEREQAATQLRECVNKNLCFLPILNYFAKARINKDTEQQWQHFYNEILNQLSQLVSSDLLKKKIDDFIAEHTMRDSFLSRLEPQHRGYVNALQLLHSRHSSLFIKRGVEIMECIDENPTLKTIQETLINLVTDNQVQMREVSKEKRKAFEMQEEALFLL